MAPSGTTGAREQAERGRAAAQRLAWDEAYEAFARADDAAPLAAADLETWATAAYLLGKVDDAVATLARAHQLRLEDGEPGAAVVDGFWATFMLVNRGDMAQAGGWVARCTALLERLGSDAPERGYLLTLEAHRLASVEHHYEEALGKAEKVVALGREAGNEDMVALALTVVGWSLIRTGRFGEGFHSLDEAMVGVVSGALSPPAAGTVYCSVIGACEEIGELRRAREWTEALTRWCVRQRGLVTFTGQCLTHRSHVLRRGGRWEEASEEARRACELFAGAADEQLMGGALYELAEIHRLRGDLSEAEDLYRRASEWGREPQPGLALLRLAQGRDEAAAATMRRLLAEADGSGDRIALLPAYVETMLATGDLAAAADAADELARVSEAGAADTLVAEAHQARGAVSLAQGNPEAALADLRKARETWRSLAVPYETARVRVLLGVACRRLGDEDTAALELDGARHTFAELGAATELGRLAALEAPRETHGLSPRELEVLRLVATGMTNQAIADELYVSVKTVDRHVANVLTKLGVPSRTAATAFAYEHDLL